MNEYYYDLAIGAYKKWKSYICSTNKSNHFLKQIMVNFEKENNFSQELIKNRIKLFVDEIFSDDINNLIEGLNKNLICIEPKISQIFSKDTKKINIKKNFMLSCLLDVKYYIYDTMYTLIILQGLHNTNLELLNNDATFSNKIALNELFDKNGKLNLKNNSLFQKYIYNYSRWQDEAKKTITKLVNESKESFILSYIDFKNFYYNIPFEEEKYSCFFDDESRNLFVLINRMREIFCEQSRAYIKQGYAIDGTYLPIGLISSMLLSELYMYNFDETISKIKNVSYYGRYCDDVLFIYSDYKENLADAFENVLSFDTELSVDSIEIDGYSHLIPNEKSRSEVNEESDSDNNDKAYIVLAPSLIGVCKKLSLKEKDLKEFISGDDGLPDDPVNVILSEIYNYLLYGGDSNTFRRIVFKMEEIINDKDKLYLMCSQLETCYSFLCKNKNYSNIKEKIDSKIQEIDFLNGIDDSKCILNLNNILSLNECIKEVVLFYNRTAYERACAVNGEENDWFKTFCYPIWICDQSIDRYVKSYSEAQEKLYFYPFNIDISELYFSGIVDFSCEKIEEIYDKYKKLFLYYFNLNGYENDLDYVKFENEAIIPYINFNLVDSQKDKSVFSSVANLDYDIQFEDRNKTNINKDYQSIVSIIINTINEFKKTKQYSNLNYLVFPELYLNPLTLRKLAKISRSLKISLIGGCKYTINDSVAENKIANLVYFQIGNHSQCLPIIRLKNEYAPKEIESLTNHGYNFKSGKNVYYIINDGFASHASMYCYELTDIKVRSFIKGKINLLIASEYNMDTFYFSNIIESVVRDISCYAVQSNVSRYGDSRITAPKSHIHMNIASIKGGITDNVIVGELKIAKLEKFKMIQELKNYICFIDSVSPDDKYNFCEYIDRLSNYYNFKNVSSDVLHQKYENKAKYVELIDLFITKVSDIDKIQKKLFSNDEKSVDVADYCKKKIELFKRIKTVIEK